MKRQIHAFIYISLLLFATSASATIVVITQQDNTFSPQTFEVNVGDTIRWVWTSGVHTTTSTTIPDGAAAWDSPLTAEMDTVDYLVTVAGDYAYVCTPHIAEGMIGSFTASGTLGISDRIASNNSMRVYPNPAKSEASLMLNTDKAQMATLYIYDLLGNRINQQEVSLKQGSNNLSLPVVDIMPGIYFVELRYTNQTATVRRFIKSR
jgi:plastocyanin